MSLEQSLEEIVTQLQELADRAAVVDVVVAYATALDTRDWDALAGLFTEDALWEYQAAGEQVRGPEAIVASPEVEFISLSHLNPSTELNPVPTRGIDLAFVRRYMRSLEAGGFDYTLVPYGSTSADSFVVASAVTQLTERIEPIVALRPDTTFPTVGAQQLATLDQLSEGRAVVHLISGGSDTEQARQGDYLPKE